MSEHLRPTALEPKVIYILCPPYAVTGGPEALHQLGAELLNKGHRVFMVYCSGNSSELRFSASAMENRVVIFPEWENPTPTYYQSYGVPFTTSIIDNDQSIVVFPEIHAHLMREFLGAQKCYWWLSLDYGLQAIQQCGGFEYLRSVNCLMLCQSTYAQRHLQEHGFLESYLISDYTRVEDDGLTISAKEDIILYNRKGAEIVDRIASHLPHMKFQMLANMTGQEVHEAMSRSKLFMDFGSHPGMDRMPREAATLGCCVMTNKRGAAAFFEDVPIAEKYKFSDPLGEIDRVQETINDIFENFESNREMFSRYRRRIGNPPVEAAGYAA